MGLFDTLRRKTKSAKQTVKENNEKSARRTVLEDLFYDFNRNKAEVFRMNFFRGVFFGFGSVVGGTIVVAVLVWVMSFFVDIPGVGDSVRDVKNTIESTQQN